MQLLDSKNLKSYPKIFNGPLKVLNNPLLKFTHSLFSGTETSVDRIALLFPLFDHE
jgi:hypothetical protein